MDKKTKVVYNSKLQKSSSVLLTPDKSLKKIRGYPSLSPNQFVGSSSKSDFKVSDSSTGGKLPIHGPRRNVKPSHFYSDEFEIKRVIFKVDKSQIKNYKSICNLAMSPNRGDDAIFFGGVRCTFWSLGESLKPGGTVNNFVIATFCYHLYSLPFGHPNVSKALYFFSNISDQLFKDLENANEDVLSRAFKKYPRNRPLYWCNMIPKFKYWWKNFGLIDMGFNNYKVHYPYIPKQPANNFSDSGVYVMMFLEHWKLPWDSLFTLFKASDIPNLRIKLANDLLLSPKNTGRKELVTSYKFEDDEEM